MVRSFSRLFALAAVLSFTAYGCADQAAPLESTLAPTVAVGGPFLSLSPAQKTVQVLERTTPLAEDVVTSRVIGAAGGVIEVREAGLRLTVPAGAVQRPTEISVRAHAGSLVAYSFEPHGTQFSRVVTADQSLKGTLAETTGVWPTSRGYFSDAAALSFGSKRVEVTEVSLLREDRSAGSVQFYLNHFSGYLIAID